MAPYTFLNTDSDVTIPESGARNKTVFEDESLRVIAFGIAADHAIPPHTAPIPIVLYFVSGEAEVTAGDDTLSAQAGAFIHMEARLLHGIHAKTPVKMLVLMLKQK